MAGRAVQIEYAVMRPGGARLALCEVFLDS